jgi:Fe-S cluster biogenesis protein NfuA
MSAHVDVSLEFTPNPNTLKYVVDRTLLERGAANFVNAEAAEKSPLAKRLFAVTGVSGVMIGKNFVTVTKGEAGEWDDLNDGVMMTLDTHLTKGDVVVKPEVLAEFAAKAAVGGTEIEQRIREILELEIRPAVAMDGGDITLDRYENGTVYLQMQGSCAGCPSSTATLRMGIETRLKDAVPEILEVVAV